MTNKTHNPFDETYRVSRLRENLTSGSDGEGLETGRYAVPRQSFTRQLVFKRLKTLAHIGHLPKHDEKASRAWLYGKLFMGLIVEKIIRYANEISPWGYDLEVVETAE